MRSWCRLVALLTITPAVAALLTDAKDAKDAAAKAINDAEVAKEDAVKQKVQRTAQHKHLQPNGPLHRIACPSQHAAPTPVASRRPHPCPPPFVSLYAISTCPHPTMVVPSCRWQAWDAKLAAVKQQEEEALRQAAAPLRAYLMDNVMPTLTQGLIEVCKARPDDPVDYLAEFLFKKNPQIS